MPMTKAQSNVFRIEVKQHGKGEREIYLSRLKMYMHNLLSYPNSTLTPCLFSSRQLLSDRSPGVYRKVLKTMVVYLSLSVLGMEVGEGVERRKKDIVAEKRQFYGNFIYTWVQSKRNGFKTKFSKWNLIKLHLLVFENYYYSYRDML